LPKATAVRKFFRAPDGSRVAAVVREHANSSLPPARATALSLWHTPPSPGRGRPLSFLPPFVPPFMPLLRTAHGRPPRSIEASEFPMPRPFLALPVPRPRSIASPSSSSSSVKLSAPPRTHRRSPTVSHQHDRASAREAVGIAVATHRSPFRPQPMLPLTPLFVPFYSYSTRITSINAPRSPSLPPPGCLLPASLFFVRTLESRRKCPLPCSPSA
jgi:hypothetical protein